MSTHERPSAHDDRLEAQARLLEDVAHELKNPLTVIHGYASFLAESDAPAADRLRALRAVLSHAERAIALVDRLQAAARRAPAGAPSEPRALDADGLLQEAVEAAEIEASRRGVRLNWRSSVGDRLQVFADPKSALQVLANLVGNALKFTPAGGAVDLHVQREDGCARFTVSDSGPGVAAADMPRLFERFYQAGDEARKRRGLGLGLAISKELVEAAGGRIWAESPPGAGARFHFTLPLAAAPR